NRLNHIIDSVPEGNYTVDLDTQDPDNYEYDATGNLTKDEAEGITSVSWSVYGKITQIVKGSESIDYTYDAAGNRISKTANGRLTVYVRDAAGNVMSVYEKPADGALAQTEIWLYGSSRLGVQTLRTVAPESVNLAAGFEAAVISTLTRGEKLFELSNHLGN